MTIITYTMEEADGLLDYQAPELKTLSLGLACGSGIGENPEMNNSGNGFVFGADGEDEEENETFSIDD